MESKLYVAVSTPVNFYFLSLPEDPKSLSTLPGSANYHYFEIRNLITELNKAYPGNERDLAEHLNVPPQYLFHYAKVGTHINSFIEHITFNSMTKILKAYYQYVLARKLPHY
jgi:hypothetical protein